MSRIQLNGTQTRSAKRELWSEVRDGRLVERVARERNIECDVDVSAAPDRPDIELTASAGRHELGRRTVNAELDCVAFHVGRHGIRVYEIVRRVAPTFFAIVIEEGDAHILWRVGCIGQVVTEDCDTLHRE